MGRPPTAYSLCGEAGELLEAGEPTRCLEILVAREREVVELVRDRKTNREIAADLFLSEKTVETHLRHIFGKLGVSTRASVARAVEEAKAK